jgi:hypothetical protein
MLPSLTKAARTLKPLSCGHLCWWHSRQTTWSDPPLRPLVLLRSSRNMAKTYTSTKSSNRIASNWLHNLVPKDLSATSSYNATIVSIRIRQPPENEEPTCPPTLSGVQAAALWVGACHTGSWAFPPATHASLRSFVALTPSWGGKSCDTRIHTRKKHDPLKSDPQFYQPQPPISNCYTSHFFSCLVTYCLITAESELPS